MIPADVSILIGRHFIARSGNVCKLSALGEGALHAGWRLEPTQADTQELDAWVVKLLTSTLGGEIEATICTDESQEKAMYEKWKKK